MLIGILAPTPGLLRTILGVIEMFRDIETVAGPVTPDILAAGLWQASVSRNSKSGKCLPIHC